MYISDMLTSFSSGSGIAEIYDSFMKRLWNPLFSRKSAKYYFWRNTILQKSGEIFISYISFPSPVLFRSSSFCLFGSRHGGFISLCSTSGRLALVGTVSLLAVHFYIFL